MSTDGVGFLVFHQIDDGHAESNSDLRGGQANSRGAVHARKHARKELADLGIVPQADRTRAHLQRRIGRDQNRQQIGGKLSHTAVM